MIHPTTHEPQPVASRVPHQTRIAYLSSQTQDFQTHHQTHFSPNKQTSHHAVSHNANSLPPSPPPHLSDTHREPPPPPPPHPDRPRHPRTPRNIPLPASHRPFGEHTTWQTRVSLVQPRHQRPRGYEVDEARVHVCREGAAVDGGGEEVGESVGGG